MRNIKLTIEYDGTDHAGWQIQRNPKFTIQGEIEEILEKILGKKVRLIASGRTDSGVHAKGQVANFKTESGLPVVDILRALNFYLPKDVAITDAKEVPLNFHARFSAKSKLYRYTILNTKVRSPLAMRYSHFVSLPLDISAMRRAARHLLGRNDYKSFQASDKKDRPSPVRNSISNGASIRTINRLKVAKDGDFIYVDIEADGFLYNMVRNIVGTLIEVGKGKISPGGIKKILQAKDRKKAGPATPAKGLCLVKVNY